ncbi:hypothetical protein EQ718_24090 (plasmid) [Paracoccus versutus]|uniref:Uncharacterized protein n=1 Tax=Paracoccus versutus TaxID=34007 RepID=A0AAQ0HC81_PARVE|nr:hypothetical protein [Paracoccus versutus]KGJ01678.1 hypothetical protein IT40_27015 [Paracoccus versutus]REG26261.1 hypothetical protein ATH84_10961 [Paracoccus versutus]WEJ80952.1 hypothetical protein EQ718_18820 [Paracoccus versutus]WEJ81883.1 hypothetical protein EQ718_24090 [Paracoccus versutus]
MTDSDLQDDQDDDDLLWDILRKIDEEGEEADAHLLRELEAIQPGMSVDPDPEPVESPKGFPQASDNTDPDDHDIIVHEVKLTRYDKAIRKRRDLEAKRAALPADHDPCKVAALDMQIKIARAAVERAESDVSRMQEGIDEWRAGVGRERRNENRRKVRTKPNADLSSMTPDQKAQHERDRRSDANWIKRRREAGMPEAQIQAELAVRIHTREAKRAEQARVDAEQAAMQELPHYGIA